MSIYLFDEKISTPLCEIMGRNKSDKGDINILRSHHNYTTFYHSIFNGIQLANLRIFELGLGTNNTDVQSNMGAQGRPGASVYGWNEYFPNSKIYGADIDKRILFDAENIKTFYCDQTNPEVIKKMWDEPELSEPFDIMVEDGLHTFSANVCFFENSIQKLASNGFYIIEDILTSEIPLFEKKLVSWRNKYTTLDFTLLRIPSYRNKHDNNLLVIRNLA